MPEWVLTKDRDSRVVLFPPVLRLKEENQGLSRRLEEMTAACLALEDEISIAWDLLGPLASVWQQATGIANRTPGWWEILEWLVEQNASIKVMGSASGSSNGEGGDRGEG